MLCRRRILALVAGALVTAASCGRGQSPVVDAPPEAMAAAATTTTAPGSATTAPATTAVPLPPPPPTSAPAPPPTAAPPPPPAAHAAASGSAKAADVAVYTGLGTWVDVYDWSHYRESTPTVGPDQVDEMAAAGVQTLYIQTAKHDTPEEIAEVDRLLAIIDRAHSHGIEVVAWYLPTLEDPANDLRRLLASAELPVDGLAVDIESRKVGDVAERNRRLVELSAALRRALPGRAVGAIVLPPVLLEVVNPNYWPAFPWSEIAPHYDVWQTMGYWTDRTWASGHRDAYAYTEENLRRLRANLASRDVAVHPVGGIGDETTDADLDGFLRAAVEHHAIGGSLYDWRTTKPDAWPRLRGFRTPTR